MQYARLLKEVRSCRRDMLKNRKTFWENNRKNFENNLKLIIGSQKKPKGWKIYVVASNLLSDKRVMPFDYDAWSSTNIIGATKKQGFEVMIFFNRAALEFLSRPALLTLVLHELRHVWQIAKSPKASLRSLVDDNFSAKLEKDAESPVKILPGEIKKEAVLEKILYCYDSGGWNAARKMVYFMHKKRENMYGGGYLREMEKEEYDAFINAQRKKSIKAFISYFN
ncbi:MAG: hypothetical protein A3H01_02445 [Candidatus Wildermuthbacteria bacterium RIFCSPLOWO2_12_FULL_40_9]|uniref:Uncharacterized protein n=1 Tax=Candidatus Wildermuthbacteria bacterium RIFCSPLOWO2_12_FULL_40_9 TaxID=1802467 RepID=A0A1G2RUS1_9BACT|nr:MAG: hypothetical protein A3H01_02445 [Candidatus Wildermuthbacteria bacterium RIFCSPLOWO2_12_FULL_40_9]